METCRSPWTVMRVAHDVATRTLPEYASPFSRHDFTLAQLFACLVAREMMKLSYRKAEALLNDTDWCARLGMAKVPDASTLCRAFETIVGLTQANRMLDLIIGVMKTRGFTGDTLALDSTMFDTHPRSRHYERRCRRHASDDKNTIRQRRSDTAKRLPKLAVGIDTRTHLIASAVAKTGLGSDAPDFVPLLVDGDRRLLVTHVLADAGYDSGRNHYLARDRLGVRSWIKAKVGRPARPRWPATDPYRRSMQRELAGTQQGRRYGQRAQVETVMSMLKRNLGDAPRARTRHAREMALLLKVLVHNLMIVRRRRGSQQSLSDTVFPETRKRYPTGSVATLRMFGACSICAPGFERLHDTGWKPADRHGR
ncbi:transposase [Phycisphaeraceae bacterium D3-23]